MHTNTLYSGKGVVKNERKIHFQVKWDFHFRFLINYFVLPGWLKRNQNKTQSQNKVPIHTEANVLIYVSIVETTFNIDNYNVFLRNNHNNNNNNTKKEFSMKNRGWKIIIKIN